MKLISDPRRGLAAIAALAVAAALAFTAPDAPAQPKPAPSKVAQLKLAQGEKRIALVIGNAAYPESPLKNPVNDARAMAQTLRGRGFEVILRENATKPQMEMAAADFGEKLTEGATGIFFYAGHGIQVNGRNYLIPVDARIISEQRVRLETLDVEAVVDQMAAARARVSMVILDACRNNPFERRFRSTGNGLAQISAPEGTLLAYATAPGKTAADGDGTNGLYTRELLRAINTPGLKVEDVFKQVRVNVSRASNGAQVPWEASSLTGDFYFAAAPASAPPSVATPSASPQGDRELAFWDAIKTSNNPREFEAYLQQFPTGTFAPLARARLDALAPASRPSPPPPARVEQPVPVVASPPTPAPRPAPPPAPAQQVAAPPPSAPAVAALTPTATPFVGKFSAGFPAGSVARNAVTLLADIGDGEIWLSSGGATSCFGKGRIEADGTIRPFDMRCVTVLGGGRGGGDIAEQARISGRLGALDGRTVLDLEWRGSANAGGTVRATPTGG